MHVEPPHGLIVWVVEPVLEGHGHLLPAAQVPQPHRPAQVVRVRQAGEDVDALVGESLEGAAEAINLGSRARGRNNE